MARSALSPGLSPNDSNVLEKLRDPEFAPSSKPLINEALPRDPNVTDESVYDSIVSAENAIVTTMITLDRDRFAARQNHGEVQSRSILRARQLASWFTCISNLETLIAKHPTYASARNNRVQALRTVYGDGLLVKDYWLTSQNVQQPIPDGYPALDPVGKNNDLTMSAVASKVLDDLNTGISLLSPKPFAAVSPTQAKTLAQLYTQRGQLYKVASQKLSMAGGETMAVFRLGGDVNVREARWRKEEFEENASRDLFMGGRYGNEVAKKVAVQSNPMAKLCGAIVGEAMRKEFAGSETAVKVGTENIPVEVDRERGKGAISEVYDEDDEMKIDADKEVSAQIPAVKIVVKKADPDDEAEGEARAKEGARREKDAERKPASN